MWVSLPSTIKTVLSIEKQRHSSICIQGYSLKFFFLLWRHTLCRLTHTCSFWPHLSFAISVCSSWIQCTEIWYNTRFNNRPYFTLALGESRLIIALLLSMWRPTTLPGLTQESCLTSGGHSLSLQQQQQCISCICSSSLRKPHNNSMDPLIRLHKR